MLDFVDMVSMARYLFAPNTLPLANLLMRSNKKALETMFSFQGMQIGADINQFQLIAGMGDVNGVVIQQLVIDTVSINLTVVGDHADLSNSYEVLRKFLTEIDSKRRMENPKLYTTTYQTQSAVKLSVPYERLIAPEFMNFLRSKTDILKPDDSSAAEIYLSNLSFQVRYIPNTDLYSLVPKMLTIEPRTGSDPKENMYYVLTPTDSNTHRQLVEEFEKTMSRVK
ncbi:MAG TPA: hypothetical protein VGE85_05200 [Terracidiphilus sp.]|jgi:hypothetical protein